MTKPYLCLTCGATEFFRFSGAMRSECYSCYKKRKTLDYYLKKLNPSIRNHKDFALSPEAGEGGSGGLALGFESRVQGPTPKISPDPKTPATKTGPHLCLTCGETDPRNFYANRTGKCKACVGVAQKKIRDAERKLMEGFDPE